MADSQTTVLPVGAVLVTGADVLRVRSALGAVVRASRRTNGGVPADLALIYDQFARAAEVVETSASGSRHMPPEVELSQSAHDEPIGADEAAGLLGCSRRNVRDLCVRGSIVTARKVGSHWFMDRAEIVGRLMERRAS